MPEQSLSWVRLSSGDLSAEIDPLGAQLSSLKDGEGRDLLWSGDPEVWNGRAPILFPIVGALAGGQYRLGSTTYELSRHGFARGRAFSLQESTSSSAIFVLRADEASLKVYPFRFELAVKFEIAGAALGITTTVRNRGDTSLYASVGYHPALRWPLPFGQLRSSHAIEFETDEPAPVRRIDSRGLLMPERFPTPIANRRLELRDALFQDDVLILDQIKSRYVVYGATAGPRIRVDFPDAPYLGLWTKPGAEFICIEPWHGVTDPQGYSGDFMDKPGVFAVAAGGEFSSAMTLTVVSA